MRKPALFTLLSASWQPFALYGLLGALLVTLVWWQLGALTGGYSAEEVAAAQAGSGWRFIFEHPLNAPFSALTRLGLYLTDNSLFVVRAVAAGCSLIAVGTFYLLTRHWLGERSAVIGTILFGTSAWFLHTARLGSPDVLMFGLLALVAAGTWLRRTGSGWAVLVCLVLGALLLYVPGMVWFVVLGALLQWKTIDRAFKRNLLAVSFGGLLFVALLVPLGFALYRDPDIARVFAGLPAAHWPDPLETLKRLAAVPLHLFIRGPLDPVHWLGRVPVLDFFSTAMFVLGGYLFLRHLKLKRTALLIILLAAGPVLIALGGLVSLTILVPFVYLVAAAGVGFMLDRWLTVFPRNRIAHVVGHSLIGLALAAVLGYSFRHYFIAWPSAPATKAVFSVPIPTPASGTIKR